MQRLHQQQIATYIINTENKIEAFNSLYEVYCESQAQDYGVVTGINYALEELSSYQNEFVSVVKMIMSRSDSGGICLPFIVHALFQFMRPDDVKQLVYSYSNSQRDIWMYLFFVEIPKEQINEETIQELYKFLLDEQLDSSKGFSLRDYHFLEKYSSVDNKVIVKATEIIFSKRISHPNLVICYFGGMFRDSKNPSALLDAYADNIPLLCDLYAFLYVSGWNLDHDGFYLCELLKADSVMIDKIADSIIDIKKNKHYNHVDSRFCAIYYTYNYVEIISCLADKIIERMKRPTRYVSGALSVLFLVPENKTDILSLQQEWVTRYIRKNAMNSEKMEYIFETVANNSFGMMKECVAAFIECNKDYSAFKMLTITPTSYGGWGSFVPHYSKCIDVLKSLLPLFTGIDTIQHKKAIEQEIEVYRKRIREEQITNIIEG